MSRLALLGIILAAFASRIWQLGAKSLWIDEGISVAHSIDGPPILFQTLIERDLHPPLYYLVLWAWMLVAGTSETAVRFPSVVASVLLVALVFRFALQLDRRAVAAGALAASLLAASPFLLFYGQEARMYAPLAAAGLGATIALWAALERRGPWRWSAYALLVATAVYLHHFGWLVPAFHGLYVLLTGGRRAWAIATAGALALYVPWLPAAARQVVRLRDTPDFWQGALSLWFVAQHTFAAFAVGFGGALERQPLVLALFLGAFGLGLAVVALRAGRAELLLICYLLVPLLVVYALVAGNPKFADRYLIVALPAFALLLARGLASLARLGRGAQLAAAVLGVGMVAISAREASRVHADEAYAKDDFRGAVDYLIGRWQPGDAAFLMIDTWQVFDYYSHGWLKRYGIGPTDNLPFVATQLNQIVAAGHTRLWVVQWNPDWADPTGSIRALFDETVDRVPLDVEGTRGLTLRLYTLINRPTFVGDRQPTHALNVEIGDALRLVGYDGDLDSPVPSGTSRKLAMYWQAQRAMAEDLAVSYRLMRDGLEWWRIDVRPAAHTYPTLYWKPDATVRGPLAIEAPPGTPAGRYRLEAIVYDAGTGRQLSVRTGDSGARLRLGEVAVAAPDGSATAAPLPIEGRASMNVDGAELVALAPLPAQVEPGASIEVATAWRGSDLVGRLLDLRLLDGAGQSWPLARGGILATPEWPAGQPLMDRRAVTIPARAAPGPARIAVQLTKADARPAESGQTLADLVVKVRTRQLDPPRMQQSAAYVVGPHGRLVGFDAPASVQRGATLRLTLYWQATGETTTGFNVFAHLVDGQERPVAQHDGPPAAGRATTTSWVAPEYVVDERQIEIPHSTVPGAYRLLVGQYDPASGQRVPVNGPTGREPGDRAVLTTVDVR